MKRRSFVRTTAAAAASGPFLGRVLGANDRIVVGQIGCGGRGRYEISICKRNPQVRIAAVCDVYQPLVDRAKELAGSPADGYQDFRRVIERNDIDAVFVSGPDHWHALQSVMACQAGKDVYCEKPLSLTIDEGRRCELKSATFSGNTRFASDRLAGLLFVKNFSLFGDEPTWFVQGAVDGLEKARH